MRIILLGFLLAVATLAFAAEGRIITLDTRPGVSVSFNYMKQDAATATLVLLSGGAGDIGPKNGAPTPKNFQERSRDYFAAQGFNVVVLNRPSDMALEYEARVSSEHINEAKR